MYLRKDVNGKTWWATTPLEMATLPDGTIDAVTEWRQFSDLARARDTGRIALQPAGPDLDDLVAMIPGAQLTWIGDVPHTYAPTNAPRETPQDRIAARRAKRDSDAREAAEKAAREADLAALLVDMGADPETLDNAEAVRAELLRINGIKEEGSRAERTSEARERALARIAAAAQRAQETAARVAARATPVEEEAAQ